MEKLRHGGGPAGEGGTGSRFQRLRQASKTTPGKYKTFPKHGSSGSFCPTFKNWVGNCPFIHQGAFCSFQPGSRVPENNVGPKDGMTNVPTADTRLRDEPARGAHIPGGRCGGAGWPALFPGVASEASYAQRSRRTDQLHRFWNSPDETRPTVKRAREGGPERLCREKEACPRPRLCDSGQTKCPEQGRQHTDRGPPGLGCRGVKAGHQVLLQVKAPPKVHVGPCTRA